MRIDDSSLSHVVTNLVYTKRSDVPVHVRVFPPSSGRRMERPAREQRSMPVYDCRPVASQLTLDEAGFAYLHHPSVFDDFYNADAVRKVYYPETAALLKEVAGRKRCLSSITMYAAAPDLSAERLVYASQWKAPTTITLLARAPAG